MHLHTEDLTPTMFFRFSKKYVPGIIVPFVTSTDLFVAATIIQKNGNTEINDTIDKKTYRNTFNTFLRIFSFTYLLLNK